jgi:hypothetical protein
MRAADRVAGVAFGLFAFPAGLAAGVAFAGGINLHYAVHRSWLVAAFVLGAVACGLANASLRRFGVASRRAWTISLIVLLGWTAGFFAFTVLTYPNSAGTARRDRVVLRTVPVYPGATFVGERVWGWTDEGGDGNVEGFLTPPAQFETDWTWRSPRGASTKAILDWYQRRLNAAGRRTTRDDYGHGAGGELDSTGVGRMLSIGVMPARTTELSPGDIVHTPAEIVASVRPRLR